MNLFFRAPGLTSRADKRLLQQPGVAHRAGSNSRARALSAPCVSRQFRGIDQNAMMASLMYLSSIDGC